MKIFTTACLIGSFLLCFIYMWLLAQAGNRHHTKAEILLALQRMEVTLLLIVFCVVGATVGALLVVRAARKQYRQEAMDNMRLLLEMSDQRPKDQAND